MNNSINKDLIISKDISNLSFFIYILLKLDSSKNLHIYYTTIEKLVTVCEYKPDRHSGKSNDKIRQTLKYLAEEEIIEIPQGIDTIKSTQLFEVIFNEDNKFEKQERFAILTDEEWKKLYFRTTKTNNPECLRVFLYLRLNMFKDREYVCKVSLNKIKNIIQVGSIDTVSNIIATLNESKLICTHYITKRVDNGTIYKNNYYSINEFDEKMQEICNFCEQEDY